MRGNEGEGGGGGCEGGKVRGEPIMLRGFVRGGGIRLNGSKGGGGGGEGKRGEGNGIVWGRGVTDWVGRLSMQLCVWQRMSWKPSCIHRFIPISISNCAWAKRAYIEMGTGVIIYAQ